MVYVINMVRNLHCPKIAWYISFTSSFPLSILPFIFLYFYHIYDIETSNNMDVSLRNFIRSLFNEDNHRKNINGLNHDNSDGWLSSFSAWRPIILLSFGVTIVLIFIITLLWSKIECIYICFPICIIKLFKQGNN